MLNKKVTCLNDHTFFKILIKSLIGQLHNEAATSRSWCNLLSKH